MLFNEAEGIRAAFFQIVHESAKRETNNRLFPIFVYWSISVVPPEEKEIKDKRPVLVSKERMGGGGPCV